MAVFDDVEQRFRLAMDVCFYAAAQESAVLSVRRTPRPQRSRVLRADGVQSWPQCQRGGTDAQRCYDGAAMDCEQDCGNPPQKQVSYSRNSGFLALRQAAPS